MSATITKFSVRVHFKKFSKGRNLLKMMIQDFDYSKVQTQM